MTTAERLRRGRELAAQRRRQAEDEQLGAFRRWLTAESQAYAATVRARDTHGPRSLEAAEAERAWYAVVRSSPGLPPDSAFQRARGECHTP